MKSLMTERAREITESVSAAPGLPLTPPPAVPLSIISTGTDDQITAVSDKVEGEQRAQDSAAMIQCLAGAIGTSASAFNTLDLIGHSIAPKNYLRIGAWVISKQDTDYKDQDHNDDDMMAFVKDQLAPKLLQLNIRSLRLLGCGTATTNEGFATMHSLAAALTAAMQAPFVVYGTNDLLFLEDFGPGGLISESKLRPSNASGPAARLVFTRQSFLAHQVPVPLTSQMMLAEPLLADARVPWPISIMSDGLSQQIWSLIEPDVAWSLPGLLAQPQRELLLPIQSIASRPAGVRIAGARSTRGDGVTSNLFYRVQILLGHQLVRVLPSEQQLSAMALPAVDSGEGLLYRVSDPARLAKLVP
jgi:hypothetical protein